MLFADNELHSPRRQVLFKNRKDALNKLLDDMPLNFFRNQDCVVVGISFAGFLFASQLAREIKAPLDFLFTSSIGAPNNTECEIAMTSETKEIIIKEALVNSFGVSLDYIYGEAQRQYEEKMLPLIYQYRKGRKLTTFKDKHILLVDEGIDSGLRAMTCIKSMLTLQVKTVYFACPVAPFCVAKMVDEITDGLFCLHRLDDFVDIGYYYGDYQPIETSVIESIFKECDRGGGISLTN
ncbi:MAG: hypothetical protein J1E31_07205 [Helicobacter sp.]|nr:hypothetical protein [Helicobacter sp.]